MSGAPPNMPVNALDFALSYDAAVTEFSGSGALPRREYAPRHASGPTGAWVHIRVAPVGEPTWVGAFKISGGACALYGMPSGDDLLVVGGFECYVVSVREPDRWYEPPVLPVCGVRRVSDCPIVLLWGFQDLVACGRDGVLWEAERLGQDEVVVERADAAGIVGSVWRGGAPGTGHVRFVVEPTTGTVVEGRL
jgi:hypothetical protein